MKKLCLVLAICSLLCLSGCTSNQSEVGSAAAEKPVIYLYPEEERSVSVTLDYDGEIISSYPDMNDGTWTVTASPDGVLTDADGRQYPYLFWEGSSNATYDFRRGFVVAGEDTAEFLEEKLAYLGLSDTEAADFITYWLPKMQDNEYNLIAFQGRAYTDVSRLDVDPAPDTVIRVFMAWKPVDGDMGLPEQGLPKGKRSGFTVVEWGGVEVE